MVVEVVERYLLRDGHEVVRVADGASAIRSFDSQSPDLIILDLMLPRVGGKNDETIATLTKGLLQPQLNGVEGWAGGVTDYLLPRRPGPRDFLRAGDAPLACSSLGSRFFKNTSSPVLYLAFLQSQ
ncbi:MAG: hypothetical protein ABIU97_00045 [Dehalococcoidia bacterium]